MVGIIGRSDDLLSIRQLMSTPDGRLVTLIGPAGVGKTRLAEAVAATLSPRDGVKVVTFASIRESARFPLVLAASLGIHGSVAESWETRIVNHLRDQQVVLVLDNLEQLLPLSFLSRLLQACPDVRCLCTSREALRLSLEQVHVVSPLPVPEADHTYALDDLAQIDSVRLLLSRAGRSNRQFVLDEDNAGAITQLCRDLDGLPLALELAGARLQIMSAASLLQRLDDRLSILTGGHTDRPEHQRTLRGAIAWSYDLLCPAEQALFRALAVFVGSFCVEDVVQMFGDGMPGVEERLLSLVDKHLVTTNQADAMPFAMLETVRAYAQEQLRSAGEETCVHMAHAAHYLHRVEAIRTELSGSQQTRATQEIDLRARNIFSAMRWLQHRGDGARYTRYAVALFRYWRLRGMVSEALEWLNVPLDADWQDPLEASDRAQILWMVGWISIEHGDTPRGEACGQEALTIAEQIGNDQIRGHALQVLAIIDGRLGRTDQAVERMEAALAAFRLCEDREMIAGALTNLAIMELDRLAYHSVIARCRESRAAFELLGNLHGVSHSLDTMSIAHYNLGEYRESLTNLLDCLQIDRQLGDIWGLAITLDHLGKTSCMLNDLVGAWEAHAESLGYRREVGDPRGYLVWLEAMSRWLVRAGQPTLAARVMGSIAIARTSGNLPLQPHETADHEAVMAEIACAIGPATLEIERSRGQWTDTEAMMREVDDAARVWLRQLLAERDLVQELARTHQLTQRETEILKLLGQRLTDREIADRLFISPRTASHHVAGLIGKLQVRSRREIPGLLNDAG